MINLYSDTQTLPTADMLRAATTAELGDDVSRLDPTVRRLEERAAELTGMEAGLFVTSGTQGNVVALMTHGRHGDEVFLDADAHVYFYEGGGLCSLAGFTPRFVAAERGQMAPDALEAAIRPLNDHFPRPRLLWVENTHNRGGGTVVWAPWNPTAGRVPVAPGPAGPSRVPSRWGARRTYTCRLTPPNWMAASLQPSAP